MPATAAPATRVLGALLALALALTVACSDGGSDPSPTAAPTETATTETPTDTPPETGPPIPGPSLDLASEAPALTVFGADRDDFGLGIPSLGRGDFNGDGLDDVIIGAPQSDGPDNSREGAGEAHILFGSDNPPETVDLADSTDVLTIYGGAEGDGLGYAALGADVNGDGLDDILLGAPGTSGTEDPRTDQGQVTVFFGSRELGPGVLDLADGPQDVTITGAEGFSRVGHAIASGDVNGDGTLDIVLGAPFAGREPGTPPGGPRTEVGEVYVIFGGPELDASLGLHRTPQDFTAAGSQQFGQFGAAVAAADVNDDGFDDIIVGAPESDSPEGLDAAGAAYIFFGASGLSGRVSIADDEDDVRLLGASESSNLGLPLATGDFNGDGTSDFAAGARRAERTEGAGDFHGAAYVFLGRGDLSGTLDLAAGDEDARILGALRGELLPSSLAAADLDGDGLDDLVIGSGGADGPGDRTRAGRAYVVLGDPALASRDLADGGQDQAVVGADPEDSLGASVQIVHGQGDRPALVLLASAADGEGNERLNSGEIYVVDLDIGG